MVDVFDYLDICGNCIYGIDADKLDDICNDIVKTDDVLSFEYLAGYIKVSEDVGCLGDLLRDYMAAAIEAGSSKVLQCILEKFDIEPNEPCSQYVCGLLRRFDPYRLTLPKNCLLNAVFFNNCEIIKVLLNFSESLYDSSCFFTALDSWESSDKPSALASLLEYLNKLNDDSENWVILEGIENARRYGRQNELVRFLIKNCKLKIIGIRENCMERRGFWDNIYNENPDLKEDLERIGLLNIGN